MQAAASSESDEQEESPVEFRLRGKIELPFKGASPNPAQIRALLTQMAVVETDPGVYRVTVSGDTFTANLNTNECDCSAGSSHGEYVCQHQYHVRYRKESGTLRDPPDREDPVVVRARESKPVAEAAMKREEQIDRAGGVVAEDGEELVQCAVCGEYGVIQENDAVDTSIGVCGSCPPLHDAIVYLCDPRTEDDNSFALVRDVVSEEVARGYYPGDESVFSLADMFSKVDGVEGGDSVVLVSKPVDVDDWDGLVFSPDTQAVPQGALRSVVESESGV